ncbi:MAG: hypothetical protein O2931_08610 [Planctomycetota bacterium]|nr:hypothetical protein [Planctomycetota bacterium]MDA1178842.1 hypothetical protein [Planctomycetota bacterium]
MKLLLCLSILSVLVVPQVARSAEVFATSYDMRNGVSPGCDCRHYWDRKYNGSGSTTTDGAFLSGGLGDLTDGIVTEDHWDVAEALDENPGVLEDSDGIGPYVGWRAHSLPNPDNNIPEPEITFHFAQSINFSKVSVHYEDHPSDVFAPGSMFVTINGETLPEHFPPRNGQGPKWTDIDLTGYSSNSLLLKLVTSGPWTLIDEVKFFDANAADPCDLNGDGRVDGADVGILYNNWGTVSSGNPADKDGSGTVDGADLARIYDSWTGDASPTSSVPEPTGSAMLVLSLVVLRRRS